MQIKILCDGIQINKSTDSNPFGNEIPLVGDEIELGLNKYRERIEGEMVLYKVVKRRFSSIGTYNSLYTGEQCILFV